MVRAFRSELTKLRCFRVLVGGAAMIVTTALIAYFTATRALSGNSGSGARLLAKAFPTTQGLITVVDTAGSLVTAIAVIMVTANIAAEWSQGTLRNLLVREPERLRWLSGKMLALLLFVVISAALGVSRWHTSWSWRH